MSYFKDSGFGTVSTGNTTVTPLASAATFTGVAEQNESPDIMCSCYSDTAGTLFFDFSINGTDWRTFPSSGFAVTGGIHEFHAAVKGPRYFRLRFVNSAATQSTLQITTYYGTFRQPNAPLNQTLGLDSDAAVVRPSFPALDIGRGLWSGLSAVHKFGRGSVGTSFVPISIGNNYQTPQSGSATALRIASGGNGNDTAAGSGAREVTLIGLDENFNEAMETVATAGASASSATATTFTRLYRAYVSASGTYATAVVGSHSGDIVIENSGGGTTWATISATDFPRSQTEIGTYSVAAGYTAYLKYIAVNTESSKTIDVIGFYRPNIDATAAPYSAMRLFVELGGLGGGETEIKPDTPMGPFNGPCDIGFMGKVSAGSGEVDVDFEILLVNE
jgi:hypothetical protein